MMQHWLLACTDHGQERAFGSLCVSYAAWHVMPYGRPEDRNKSVLKAGGNAGDMPIILTCDGPSLGGFVCPATTISAQMWKWGQVRPGDKVRFAVTTVGEAVRQLRLQKQRIGAVRAAASDGAPLQASQLPVRRRLLHSAASSMHACMHERCSCAVATSMAAQATRRPTVHASIHSHPGCLCQSILSMRAAAGCRPAQAITTTLQLHELPVAPLW
jgi:hypothetical protein